VAAEAGFVVKKFTIISFPPGTDLN